jgi:O-antigen ligase
MIHAIFIAISFCIVIYGLINEKARNFSFTLAVAVNIFPFTFYNNYMHEDFAIYQIPLAYIPIAAAGLSLILATKVRIIREDIFWVLLSTAFFFYTLLTSFRNGFDLRTLFYVLAFPFNFMLFLVARAFFSKVDSETGHRVLKSICLVLFVGCLVCWFKDYFGFGFEPNFMPMITRNGTVVFVAMVAPLFFYLYEKGDIGLMKALLFWGVLYSTAVLIGSRAGIVGLIFSTFFYYMRFRVKSLLIVGFFVTIMGSLFLLDFGDYAAKRMIQTKDTVLRVNDDVEVLREGSSENVRLVVILSAIEIFKHNMWFGTGLGYGNYIREYDKYGLYVLRVKSHSFYFSYLAELGIVGYSMLIALLMGIYQRLAPLSGEFRAFRISFLTISVMMLFNEFIYLPELWFFYGMLAGISRASNQNALVHQKPMSLQGETALQPA